MSFSHSLNFSIRLSTVARAACSAFLSRTSLSPNLHGVHILTSTVCSFSLPRCAVSPCQGRVSSPVRLDGTQLPIPSPAVPH